MRQWGTCAIQALAGRAQMYLSISSLGKCLLQGRKAGGKGACECRLDVASHAQRRSLHRNICTRRAAQGRAGTRPQVLPTQS